MRDTIRIHKEDNNLIIYLPYSPDRVKKTRTIPNRKWDPKRKAWIIPQTEDQISKIKTLFPSDRLQAAGSLPAITNKEDLICALDNELKLRQYSYKTRKVYRNQFRRFINAQDKPIGKITEDEIRNYLLYLVDDKGISRSYLNQVISTLKFAFRHIIKRPFAVEGIPRPKEGRFLPVVLSRSEIVRIFKTIVNIKHRTLLILTYSSGLRVGAVVKLRLRDIDFDRGMIHIRKAKGQKDRYVPLSSIAEKILTSYWRGIEPRNWIFEGQRTGRHLTERTYAL